MKLYGLYEISEYETLVYFGTAKEIARFLGVKESSFRRCYSRSQTIGKKERYNIKEIEIEGENTDET